MSDESIVAPAVTPRTARPARARSLSCPNCGSPVTIRATGISITAACASCGAVLDVANDDVRLIAAAQARTRSPEIAIGTRGTIDGTEWEVVGYQVRSSEGGSWRWDEYLLFNPYQGFRFLGADHGTWTLYVLLRQAVDDDGRVAGDPHHYRLDVSGTAATEYVLGEFYWRVKAGDVVEFREFVDGSHTLSQERNGTEVTWSRGTRLDASVVRTAFRLDATLSTPNRVADAPARSRADGGLGRLWAVAASALVLLIIAASVNFGLDRNLLVYQRAFTAAPSDRDRPLPSPVFTVPDSGGNLTLEISAYEPRDWLDLDVALVSASGDRRFDVPVKIDPYQTDRTANATFASVPGGSDKLLATASSLNFISGDALVHPVANAPPHAPVTFAIAVRRHTPTMSYFWIAFLAILAWPVCVTLWHWYRSVQNDT